MLGKAVELREALPDDAAAAVSRANLGLLAVPVAVLLPVRSTAPVDDLLDLETLPLRDRPPAVRAPHARSSWVALNVLLSVVVGWLGYLALERGRPQWPVQRPPVATTAASQPPQEVRDGDSRPVLESAVDLSAVDPPAATTGAQTSSILIFTARPGSIATTRSTELCYAVSGADQARIEPGIGDVNPTNTLSCRRVAPRRTTTYELIASGRDGQHARRQVVVFVR
jgi:hypothetical protein